MDPPVKGSQVRSRLARRRRGRWRRGCRPAASAGGVAQLQTPPARKVRCVPPDGMTTVTLSLAPPASSHPNWTEATQV
jgi:hypothetical protein